jgi:hypothetical protein
MYWILAYGLNFQSYMPNFGVYLFLNNKLFFGELSEVNPQVAPSLPKTPFRVEEVDNL